MPKNWCGNFFIQFDLEFLQQNCTYFPMPPIHTPLPFIIIDSENDDVDTKVFFFASLDPYRPPNSHYYCSHLDLTMITQHWLRLSCNRRPLGAHNNAKKISIFFITLPPSSFLLCTPLLTQPTRHNHILGGHLFLVVN